MKEELQNPETENKLKSFIGLDYANKTEEEILEEEYEQYYGEEIYPFEWHKFALGLKHDGKIIWRLLLTNRRSTQTDSIEYDLGIKLYRIEKIMQGDIITSIINSTSILFELSRGKFP